MTRIFAIACVAGAMVALPACAGEDHGKMAMGHMGMDKMIDHHMQMMDTNGDGMVSLEEHRAAAEKMFMEADTNGDKMVSKQEMTDMKMKEHHKMMDMKGDKPAM